MVIPSYPVKRSWYKTSFREIPIKPGSQVVQVGNPTYIVIESRPALIEIKYFIICGGSRQKEIKIVLFSFQLVGGNNPNSNFLINSLSLSQ